MKIMLFVVLVLVVPVPLVWSYCNHIIIRNSWGGTCTSVNIRFCYRQQTFVKNNVRLLSRTTKTTTAKSRVAFPSLFSTPNRNDSNDPNNDEYSFLKFNPLNYNAATVRNSNISFGTTITDANPLSSSSLSSLPSSSNNERTTMISLRKTQMQQLSNELISVGTIDDISSIQRILQENRNFLIEPLEDPTTILDEDTIELYKNCRTRYDRYRAYDRAMMTRIINAKNPSVKQILIAMKEFVMSCEHHNDK